MKLTVLIPAYNEAATLSVLLDRLLTVPLILEIIVIDDGSTDSTAEAVQPFESRGVKFLRHQVNRGKGAAIRTGAELATGDAIVIQDGDLEYDPHELVGLMEPLIEGETEVVFGSRILGSNPRSYRRYLWGGRLLTFVANLLFHIGITDEPTCYKILKTDLFRSLDLQCTGFEFCPEVTAKLARRGIRIVERPVTYRPRSFEEGKKIRSWDGIVAVWVMLKYRVLPRRYSGSRPGKP